MTSWEVEAGDCRELFRGIEGATISAIVTDPPYELGFMGKAWDASGIAYDKEMWSEALRVLKPGGYLLSFGGSRTYHRMACAIEDAGFEVRDQMMWLYGSGFPKSMDAAKAIDKKLGTEHLREFKSKNPADRPYTHEEGETSTGWQSPPRPDKTHPGSDEARQWEGWGTALKPAHEPIVVARKPLAGTVAENLLEHGTGAINIDGCRIGRAQGDVSVAGHRTATFGTQDTQAGGDGSGGWVQSGRWPANVIFQHSSECRVVGGTEETVGGGASGTSGFAAGYESGDGFEGRTVTNAVWECVPDCPVKTLDEQSGTLAAGNHPKNRNETDSGGASRFFYCAKANKRERSAGLDDKNTHPTVKPIDLMRYLVRLVTPKGGTVLDPFTGSGTTGIAAVLEGMDFIGFEQDPEYARLALTRIDHWARNADQQMALGLE